MTASRVLCVLATTAAATLVPLDAPPPLSSPVFSLATLDAAGRTNMNVLTYATPVGIRPTRLWAISLYRGTLSHANWIARPEGVLQQLAAAHAPLMWELGGTSGAEADKAAACAARDFAWLECAECTERLLPSCVAYFRLVQQGPLVDAGCHDVVICRLEQVWGAGEAVGGAALSTAELREAGLITAAGRAVEPSQS